jgi:hypothetical protein
VGWLWWWRVECDAQPDLDVPAGHADVFDEQAQQLLFLGVIEGHSCASIAISSGVNVLALSRMLGHTSAKVTLDTYADLFDTDLDAVASALDLKCAHSVPKRVPNAVQLA